MAAQRRSRRGQWISLAAAVIFFAVAIAVLVLAPSSPINTAHTTQGQTPVQVTLPPTAPLPSSTATHTQTHATTTATPRGTTTATATPTH